MDIKIWENTIVTWLNALNTSLPVINVNQINNSVLNEVIKKINLYSESSPVQFLKEIFPNLTESDKFTLSSSVDYLCASTLLLVYVSLTQNEELKEIRELMCRKLDTSVQLNIVEFLNAIQEYENVFTLSFKNFKQEIFPHIFLNFKEKHCGESIIGDTINTPVKSNSLNSSFDSPLQGFFQTPKRSGNKSVKYIYSLCGDGDHTKRIKKLTDQLAEEELEKAALQEKLNFQTSKCNEYELKVKNKIEEIKHLQEEWEKESKKSEEEIASLNKKIAGRLEAEKKFKSEVSYLESYVSKLESDLSVSVSKNEKLESQLKEAFEKIAASELQLKETTKLCSKLQSAVADKERDLQNFKENYASLFNDENSIDISYMNGSFNKSIGSPENLGVVVDKLLSEKVDENAQLQESINQLQMEKIELIEKIKVLNEQVTSQDSVISELQFSKDELNAKLEYFEKTEKELMKTQKELVLANAELIKLNKESSHLTEKYNILNSKLQEREQILIGCKNSKMLLQVNFLKLAEDLKNIQQRLECEVSNISKLALRAEEKSPKSEWEPKLTEVREQKITPVGAQKAKALNNDEISHGDSFLSDDNFGKLSQFLLNVENRDEWAASKASLQKTFTQLNDNVILLNKKIQELKHCQERSLQEKSKLELCLKEAEERVLKLQSSNSGELKKVQAELEKKEKKIKELEEFIQHYKKVQNELLVEKEQLVKASFKGKNQKPVHEGGDHKHKTKYDRVSSVVSSVVPEKVEALENQEHHDFSDSLEEIPVPNKTFDIVNLEERNIIDKTFSIKKEDAIIPAECNKKDTAWTVSPPSKASQKKASKETVKGRGAVGESWVVPFEPAKSKEKNTKKSSSSVNDLSVKTDELTISELQTEIKELTKECQRLQNCCLESNKQRQKDREIFEKNQDSIRRNISNKYETQLEHLKSEMKQLYNRELAKHKHEQSSLNSELQDQNKRYKEHIDELRNQLWELGDKLLQEQTLKRDLKRNFSELKEKYESLMLSKDSDLKIAHISDIPHHKEAVTDETVRSSLRQIPPNGTFPTIPTEDEDEVFDNRFLEDMKLGICKTENPEDRLKELQYRNSLCLPHLKSSYPGETQFHNPALFKESDLKFGLLQFTQESQSLTDSDHSMTKSLLPDAKGKKKEQTSYKRPGPPTPSKNGGRLSIHSGDVKLTPRNVLKEINDQNERNKGTPNPLKFLLSSKGVRRGSLGVKDENAAPVTPRKKKFFRKPFGARDH